MRVLRWAGFAGGLMGAFALGWALSGRQAQGGGDAAGKGPPSLKGWTPGKGWGPWGKDDEVGALNAMTADTVKAALSVVKQGKVYDLGVNYDRESFRWPGHNPGEILTFRGPEG